MATTGAWFLGGYRKGMAGTLGESLDLATADNLGWTLRSWKYELAANGFKGAMVLDSPTLGDAARAQIVAFQADRGLDADGVIGPHTGQSLLAMRISAAASYYGVLVADVRGIVQHESSYDVGAVGYIDPGDRGCTQYHVIKGGRVLLSQAIRPAVAIQRLASHLRLTRDQWDADAAVVSWNVGDGGAQWWFDQGKPASGSPDWWTAGDLAARATSYLAAVRAVADPR